MPGMGDFRRAANIKAPAADEEEVDWILYDEGLSGQTANVDITFFDKTESADTKQDTNMPVANQLPQTQRFSVNSIMIEIDHQHATGDLQDLIDNSVIELKVSEKRRFIAPAQMLVPSGQVNPMSTESTVDTPELGGQSYYFTMPIGIPGGTDFKLVWTVGATTASADMAIKVMLVGLLIRPKD